MIQTILGLPAFTSILLGYGLFTRKFLKIEFAHGLIFSLSCLLSIYFIAALLFVLDPVIYCSFVLGGGFFIYVLIDFFRNNKLSNFLELFTQDVIVFVVTIIWFYFYLSKLTTYGNISAHATWGIDEYSHWGLIAKEMNIYHGLRSDPSMPTGDLPPFIAYTQLPTIFQYAVSKLLGFTAGNNSFSNAMIYIIYNSIFLVERRFWWSIILTSVAIFPSLFQAVISINSLHLDGTVGIVFASVMALYIQTKKYNNTLLTLILISPILFILPNIKEVGYWFAFAAILLIMFDKILREDFKNLDKLFLILLLPLIGKLLWRAYVLKMGSSFTTMWQLPFVSLFEIITMTIRPEFQMSKWEVIKLITIQMIQFFKSNHMYYTYIISGLVLGIIYITKDKQQLKNYLRITLLTSFIFVIFCVFRLHLFIAKFSIFEAKIAACYARYLGTYVIVFMGCSLSYLKILIEENKILFFNFYNLLFMITLSILSFMSVKKIYMNISVFNQNYFIKREKLIKDLIADGLDEKLNFKEVFTSAQQCYMYNYIKAPYADMEKLNKCTEDMQDKPYFND